MKRGIFVQDYDNYHVDVRVYEPGTPGELHVIHYSIDEPENPRINGAEAMLTHWYPDEDEIRRMIDGKPISLSIVGTRHPWVKVGVSE